MLADVGASYASKVGVGGWVEVTAFPLGQLLVAMKQSWLWRVGGILYFWWFTWYFLCFT
jgi:hypothetical protein